MAPDFTSRSGQIEIMDDLGSTGEVVEQSLRELDFINRWLGGNALTFDALDQFVGNTKEKVRIADLGCGGGEMLRQVAVWARKRNLEVELEGFDANPFIAHYAQEQSRNFPEIKAFPENVLSTEFTNREFDVVLCTLFLHHFTSDELVEFLARLKSQTSRWIIINDLHRHWLAYHSIWALTQAFSKSKMVKNDGPLSVLRGFSKKEILSIMDRALIKEFHLTWRWAFRWQWIISCA